MRLPPVDYPRQCPSGIPVFVYLRFGTNHSEFPCESRTFPRSFNEFRSVSILFNPDSQHVILLHLWLHWPSAVRVRREISPANAPTMAKSSRKVSDISFISKELNFIEKKREGSKHVRQLSIITFAITGREKKYNFQSAFGR